MVTVFPSFRTKDSTPSDRLVGMPTSPLPDTSALEAGILQDERPSRLSRVQDNVRNLLRTSIFGSVASSPTTPLRPDPGRAQHASLTPITIPRSRPVEGQPGPPSSASLSPAHQTSSPVNALPLPAQAHQRAGQQHNGSSHYQSTLFNNRAVTALDHPDLSDPSMKPLSQHKSLEQPRSRSGTARSQHKRYYRGRRAAKKAACSRMLICVLAALLLGALVATYISVATTATGTTTAFHVLFVLGIILSVIVFSHTALRLCITARKRSAAMPTFTTISSHGHAFRRPHHRSQSTSRRNASIAHTRSLNDLHSAATRPDSFSLRAQAPEQAPYIPWSNTQSRTHAAGTARAQAKQKHFLPPAPIKVHILSSSSSLDLQDDVIPSSHRPTVPLSTKDSTLPPPPPPAYGRWRGSVKADPELLHWVPSPTTMSRTGEEQEEELPSPTYEEVVGGPPSYRTRESPPRGRAVGGGADGVEMREVGRAV